MLLLFWLLISERLIYNQIEDLMNDKLSSDLNGFYLNHSTVQGSK